MCKQNRALRNEYGRTEIPADVFYTVLNADRKQRTEKRRKNLYIDKAKRLKSLKERCLEYEHS